MITLDTTCEFSFTVTEYVGYSYWLYQKGIPHRIIINTSMQPFFYWIEDDAKKLKGNSWDKAIKMCFLMDKHPNIIERNDGSLQLFLEGNKGWWTEEKKQDYIKNFSKVVPNPSPDIFETFQQLVVPTSKQAYMKNGRPWDPYKQYQTWTPPPYKKHYLSIRNPLSSEKPVILINNKSNIEWNDKVYNRLPIQFLKAILRQFSNKFNIWYIRNDKEKTNNGFFDGGAHTSWSKNDVTEYDDEFLQNSQTKKIRSIYQLMEETGIDNYNLLQLYMHAKAKYIITVNGGNACLSSYFGDDVVIYSNKDARSAERHIWLTGTWLDQLEKSNKVSGYLTCSECLRHMSEKWI